MKLLFDIDADLDSWGTKITDFCKTAVMAGEYGATEENVVEWNHAWTLLSECAGKGFELHDCHSIEGNGALLSALEDI